VQLFPRRIALAPQYLVGELVFSSFVSSSPRNANVFDVLFQVLLALRVLLSGAKNVAISSAGLTIRLEREAYISRRRSRRFFERSDFAKRTERKIGPISARSPPKHEEFLLQISSIHRAYQNELSGLQRRSSRSG